jgi:flagellin-like protein
MKGLSPFIAAVMLIAFTVAVGGIISIFLTGFFKSSTASVGSGGQALISCAGANPTVDLVKYTSAGTGTYVNVTFSNPGSLTIQSVSVQYILSNGTVFTFPSGSLAASASNATSNLVGPTAAPSEVRVIGTCVSTSGNQTVSGSCLSTGSCMTGV